MTQSFEVLTPLTVDGQTYHYYRLDALRRRALMWRLCRSA